MEKQRVEWIDLVKGFCMFAIIMCHSGWPELYRKVCDPVFLSAYFFTAGYTFNKKDNFKSFILNKIKSLIVPLLSFGIFNTIIAYIVDGDNIVDRLQGLLIQRTGWNDDLWFVACLFTTEIIFYFILMISKTRGYIIFLSLLLSIFGDLYIIYVGVVLPWQFEKACVLVIFLALGYYLKIIEKKYENFFIKLNRVGWVGVIFLALMYVFVVFKYENPISIYGEQYGVYPLFLLTAIIGLLTLTLFCYLLEKCSFKENLFYKFILFVGKNTLTYYAFQSKIIRIVTIIIPNSTIKYNIYIYNIVISAIVYVILMIPAIIIRKYFPFMLGKKYKKNI